MNDKFIASLKPSGKPETKNGIFFKGLFKLEKLGDTFIDFTNYQKGIVWVNGNNLGRFWNIGPQKRLYCPSSWLKSGDNEIIVFDLHQINPESVTGKKTLE
jgi:beta-galactosidase GanA